MSDVKKIATREAYGSALVELGAEIPNMVVLDADLAGSTKTGMFQKAYPDRFFNCGIAVICRNGILPCLCRIFGLLFARIRHRKNVGALCHEIKQLFLHDVPPQVQTHMRQSTTANSR